MRGFERAGALAWQLVGLAAAAAVTLWVLSQLKLVVIPLLLALLLSSFSVGMVDRLERWGVRRSLGAGVVVVSGAVGAVGVVVAAVPRLLREMRALVPKTQAGAQTVLDWASEQLPAADLEAVRAAVADPVGWLSADAAALGVQALPLVGAAGEFLAMTALTLVFWFFLARDIRRFGNAAALLVPSGARPRAVEAARAGWQMLRRFLLGTSVVATVDAVGIGVGLLLLGVPAAGALTVLVFLGGFIPVVGATVTGVLAVLVALASGGLGTAAAVALVVLVVQQVESNVLQPLVMRRAVRLHPMVTLGALSVGASTAGLLGAFMAVPVSAFAVAAARVYRPS